MTGETATDSGRQSRDLTPAERRHLPRIHWPGNVLRLALALLFLLLSDSLSPGPRWLLLVLVLLFFFPINVARWRGRPELARYFAAGLTTLTTALVAGSAALLVSQLLAELVPARELLLDGALIWVGNVLNFSVWYWQIDAGGPDVRHHHRYRDLPTDFLFPQQTMNHPTCDDWSPGFLDYVFVAFNASTAFSPTDTLVLRQRAKALMMLQSLISLVVIGVLIARAINTLGS